MKSSDGRSLVSQPQCHIERVSVANRLRLHNGSFVMEKRGEGRKKKRENEKSQEKETIKKKDPDKKD
jgi:hypothetical protein